MGTNGTYGFRYNGKDYLTYNHFDSYPQALGIDLINQFLKMDINDIKLKLENINVVSEHSAPTIEHRQLASKNHLIQYIGNSPGEDYYSLFRNMQGDILTALRLGIWIENKSFIKNSLSCEYAYIFNLDDNVFEFYKGFQKQRHNSGRYAQSMPQDGYYACALESSIPFNELSTEYFKEIISLIG